MRLARRTLIACALAPWPRPSGAGTTAPERWVWLRNEWGDEVALAYRRGDHHDPVAMARLRHLLRDRRAATEGPLPPLLVDMLSALQEQWGYERPIVVKSGFRTAATNRSLEGAAPGSLHLRGMAVDIAVPGMPLEDVSGRAWLLGHRLGFMGIGLYEHFVHLDIGPHRVWTRLRR
jgi:uncharacterized protein YcbK (DUF882 family)